MTTTTARAARLVTLAALFLAATGCGAIAENVTENVAERAIEAENGGEVDIDLDDAAGGISVESSDGTFQIGSQEIPESFPDRIPLPDDATPVSSMTADTPDGASFSLSLTTDADVATLADDLQARVEAAGFSIDATTQVDDGGNTLRTFRFSDDEWEGNVIVSRDADAGAVVNYSIVSATE